MMKSLLYFDSMLTPKIITIVYWVGLVAILLGGIGKMFAGYEGFTFSSFIVGIVGIVVGAVLLRIWCELLIVLFKIHANLRKIAEKE